MGAAFPENNSLADILMLAFGKIREKIEGKVWKITPEEMSLVDKIEFESLIPGCEKGIWIWFCETLPGYAGKGSL